jgi:hypothetical protein
MAKGDTAAAADPSLPLRAALQLDAFGRTPLCSAPLLSRSVACSFCAVRVDTLRAMTVENAAGESAANPRKG